MSMATSNDLPNLTTREKMIFLNNKLSIVLHNVIILGYMVNDDKVDLLQINDTRNQAETDIKSLREEINQHRDEIVGDESLKDLLIQFSVIFSHTVKLFEATSQACDQLIAEAGEETTSREDN